MLSPVAARLTILNGSAVTAGQFPAGWTPVGAVKTASGYEVAGSVLAANEYVVWNIDSNGDYTSAPPPASCQGKASLWKTLTPSSART
jgi:hypothetical protein